MTYASTAQIDMWNRPRSADSMRYYQTEAVYAVAEAFESHNKVLIEMATGAGKTQTFSEVARLWPGRVLVLAHRDELIQQARSRLEAHCGESVGVEQGQFYSGRERIVVGSFDTVRQQKRLARMVAAGFGLVIADEAHHALAKSYLSTLRALTEAGARLLGVTATPDRGDKKALGIAFDHCAYRMGIRECIGAGYLVPVHGVRVGVESIDLTTVSVSAGDLNLSELDEVLIKGVEGIVKKTLELWPDRKGVAFFPGVRSAELAALRFNQEAPGSAVFVCGSTPEDERRQIMSDIKRGKYRYLCNAMIATEGFDWPEASLVICGRPTKSRGLFAQMAGRGTRVLPGVVDHIPGAEGAPSRREAIGRSCKTDCIIADFVGNSGRHSLAGVEDVLGGDYTEAEKAQAKKLSKDRPVDTIEALKQARLQLQKQAALMRSKVSAKVETFNPLQVFHCSIAPSDMTGPRVTENQRAALVKMGVSEKDAATMTKQAASKFFRAASKRRELGLATFGQLKILRRYGIDAVNISMPRASQAIDYLASQGWQASKIDGSKLAQIAGVK